MSCGLCDNLDVWIFCINLESGFLIILRMRRRYARIRLTKPKNRGLKHKDILVMYKISVWNKDKRLTTKICDPITPTQA